MILVVIFCCLTDAKEERHPEDENAETKSGAASEDSIADTDTWNDAMLYLYMNNDPVYVQELEYVYGMNITAGDFLKKGICNL